MAEHEATARQPKRSRPARQARRAARLAAVQALYQRDTTGQNADQVVTEFLTIRLASADEETGLDPALDRPWFSDLVRGVADAEADLDRMLDEALSEPFSVARLERVLRAILRAGVFELLRQTAVPPRVVIDEYVEIAHDFFGGREPSLVNGVLDRLAHVLRAEELGAGAPSTVPPVVG